LDKAESKSKNVSARDFLISTAYGASLSVVSFVLW
jgi:hypothetical protein